MGSPRYLSMALWGFFAITPTHASEMTKKCLFVSSYHHGYAWNDGIELGVLNTLSGKCDIRQFNLDTKRHPNPAEIKKKALEAKLLIDNWKPDVVIAADDNASKYLVKPYYKDAKTPFVFCGVNWSGQEYGYPYSNATGIIEVNAIQPLFGVIRKIKPDAKKAFCLGVDNETDRKLCERFVKAGAAQGIEVTEAFVLHQSEWQKKYLEGQKSDLLILPTNAGINDWNEKSIRKFILKNTKKLSVSVYDWMTPYVMLALTNVAEEQGESAAEIALRILNGASPSDLPMGSNRKWNTWVNPAIATAAKLKLPDDIVQVAEIAK